MDEHNIAKSTSNVGNQMRYDEYQRILKEGNVFSKMDKLYCFKYDKENGKLTKIEIPEYRIVTKRFTGRKIYCFEKPKINKSDSHYQVLEEKIDRFVNDKVFTFNPDVENAKQIIYRTLEEKRDKAYVEYCKYGDMVNDIYTRGIEYEQ